MFSKLLPEYISDFRINHSLNIKTTLLLLPFASNKLKGCKMLNAYIQFKLLVRTKIENKSAVC